MQKKTITIKFDERAMSEFSEIKNHYLVALHDGRVIVIPKHMGIETVPACVGGCNEIRAVVGCPLHDPK